jgi:hypothetical protein
MDDHAIRDATCIVGVGNSRYGNFPQTDDYGLGVEALRAALDDAGLTLADIDGLIVGRIRSYETFSEMTGLNRQRLNLQLNSAGRFFAVSVMQTVAAEVALAHPGFMRASVARTVAERDRVAVITGANLPMLLRALCYRQGTLADTADKALAGGTQGVVRVAASVPQNQMQRAGTHRDPARLHDQQ